MKHGIPSNLESDQHPDPLSPDDARALLLAIAPHIGLHADALARACDYLPLPLRLAAGALAVHDDIRVDDYVRALSPEAARCGPVEATLARSYDLLSPQAQKAWRMVAIFPGDFGAAAAAELWAIDLGSDHDMLGDLVRYGLIERNPDNDRYRLHAAAHPFADARLAEGACNDACYDPTRHHDLRVIFHDGGPKTSQAGLEYMWIRICGKAALAYSGILLNKPHRLQTVTQGQRIMFMVPAGWKEEKPLFVTAMYLEERARWDISACDRCGLSELFDPPSALARKTFPPKGGEEDARVMAFTQFCPYCGGVMVLHLKSHDGTASSAATSERPPLARNRRRRWLRFWPQ
jgi:hypothetical protein